MLGQVNYRITVTQEAVIFSLVLVLSVFQTMKMSPRFTRFFFFAFIFLTTLFLGIPWRAYAALSFCNRTQGPIEAALSYHEDGDDKEAQDWVSEGWWRIEPGQCARVYGQPLTQRFYFYYAHALTQTMRDAPPTLWSGKYNFCTDEKAFRITGDGDCTARSYQATGFQELDIGAGSRDYTLDFRDGAAR